MLPPVLSSQCLCAAQGHTGNIKGPGWLGAVLAVPPVLSGGPRNSRTNPALLLNLLPCSLLRDSLFHGNRAALEQHNH